MSELMTRGFDLALWLAGIGHFCILGASFQIPFRFNWREELAKLSPVNRKLMWSYSLFTVLTIIAFGVLTLVLHSELLRGDRAAIALATFIGVFWLLRVILDVLLYGHSVWPKGFWFVIGHMMLTSLFVALTTTYLGLVVWHWWGKGTSS